MKKLLFLALALVLVLTSCERKSEKKVDEHGDVVLFNGIGDAVLLPIYKIGEVTLSTPILRNYVVETSAKLNQSAVYRFTYQPRTVYVKLNEFNEVVVIIKATVYNKKAENILIEITSQFYNGKMYEFKIKEFKDFVI